MRTEREKNPALCHCQPVSPPVGEWLAGAGELWKLLGLHAPVESTPHSLSPTQLCRIGSNTSLSFVPQTNLTRGQADAT